MARRRSLIEDAKFEQSILNKEPIVLETPDQVISLFFFINNFFIDLEYIFFIRPKKYF